MKFEKFVNSAFFHFFEVLYQFILFNMLFVLTLILGLGIFSYMIGLVVLVLAIKSLGSGKTLFIVKTWILNVRKHYRKAFLVSLIYSVAILFFSFDTVYFYLATKQNPILYYQICFYLFLFLDALALFACAHAAFIFVYFPNLNVKKTVLFSIRLIRLIPIQTIGLIVGIVATAFLVYVVPFVVLFVWFSLLVFLFYAGIRKIYQKLVADGVTSLSFDDH